MNILGLTRLQRTARRAANLFRPGAIILLYHRVTELPSDPQWLCVTRQRFAEHLKFLQKHTHPLRLQQMVRALRDGNLPRQSVVVTFDDGYADNLYNAKPLLEHYDIPATVFVTTGYIETKREFWWDELDRLLLQSGTLPETLRLRIKQNNYQWELGEAAHYSVDNYERNRSWHVGEQNNPTPRQRLYRSLCPLLRPLSDGERQNVLDQLLAWSGAESLSRPTHRTLSSEEIISLADGDLVEVGAHSVTHPVLSAIQADAQRNEIRASKNRLETILGRPVSSFAYPFGGRRDYSMETVANIREVGFSCSCSNFSGNVRRDTDLFQLPRYLVRNWDERQFAERIMEWFRD
jgi:peptidoglycan/xylan/chitin deacetylase (PgdA/CDA1 family)